MDLVSPSPLFDLFRRGDVPREVKLLAAQGVVAPRASEQLAILVLLTADSDPAVAAAARQTIDSLPRAELQAFLARQDVTADVRSYFDSKGVTASGTPLDAGDRPLIDAVTDAGLDDLEQELEDLLSASEPAPSSDQEPTEEQRKSITTLPVMDKVKMAMRGTREQRSVLVRDANKLVSTAVLSSPKLTQSEVETFARMGNVTDEVLRIIGSNRTWTKNYAVMAALTRNPKTPPTISMPFVSRLSERDLKGLATDRNIPEGLRLTARKLISSNESRRQ